MRMLAKAGIAGVVALLTAGVGERAAAAPSELPVQGVVRDNTGNVVESGQFAMTFALYPSAEAEQSLWKETHPPGGGSCVGGDDTSDCVAVHDGAFTARLGEHDALPLSLFRDRDALWLGISIEGEPELPRRPLGSSGWAMSARHAAMADDLQCSGCLSADDVGFAVWQAGDEHAYRASGRVGIGTDSPSHALTVAEDGDGQGSIAIRGQGTDSALRLDDAGGSSRHALYVDGGTNTLRIGNPAYDATVFDGRPVGIGTSAPDTRLDLEGGDFDVSGGRIRNEPHMARYALVLWMGNMPADPSTQRGIPRCWVGTGDIEPSAGGGRGESITAYAFDHFGGSDLSSCMQGAPNRSSDACVRIEFQGTSQNSHDVYGVTCDGGSYYYYDFDLDEYRDVHGNSDSGLKGNLPDEVGEMVCTDEDFACIKRIR